MKLKERTKLLRTRKRLLAEENFLTISWKKLDKKSKSPG